MWPMFQAVLWLAVVKIRLFRRESITEYYKLSRVSVRTVGTSFVFFKFNVVPAYTLAVIHFAFTFLN